MCLLLASASGSHPAADSSVLRACSVSRRRGYQLYGGRVLPAALVGEMTKGHGDYGLRTTRLGDAHGIGAAFSHVTESPNHTSMVAVIPEKKLSVALLLAGGTRNISDGMVQLAAALQPLLN